MFKTLGVCLQDNRVRCHSGWGFEWQRHQWWRETGAWGELKQCSVGQHTQKSARETPQSAQHETSLCHWTRMI